MNLDGLLSHAIEVYEEIVTSNRPADAVLSQYLRARKYLGSHDRKFISESVYGALREHLTIESIAGKFLAAQNLPPKFHITFILVFFLLEHQRVQTASLYAALKARYAFRDATLEAIANFWEQHKNAPQGSEKDMLSWQYAFPAWMTERLLQTMPSNDVASLYAALNRPAPVVLRVNTMKTTREALQEKLSAEGIETYKGELSPDALYCRERCNVMQTEAFRQGWFEIQDEGSQLISLLVNPVPHQKILDACAGGGGKTLHLATLMQGKGKVFAFEKYEKRWGNIRKRIRRSGLQNIEIVPAEKFKKFEEKYRGKLDAVLIDAPCTGSGTVRRNPDLKLRLTESALKKMSAVQSEILSQYAPFVKSGGTVVYATCSIFKEENEQIIETFLDKHQEFKLVKPEVQLQAANRVQELAMLMQRVAKMPYLKLLPHQDGTDGFFAAVLMKT
jgi:16S rRNA (cytosine967-C5)-methyltransferase